jgi:hypothetical protein
MMAVVLLRRKLLRGLGNFSHRNFPRRPVFSPWPASIGQGDSMTARRLATISLATLLAACGSSTTSTPAKMTVRLVDSPAAEFTAVTLFVKSVEIASDGGWTTLGTIDKPINLLALQNGAFETLALDAQLPPGHYGQMRLLLGTPNTVTLKDGSTEDLTIPSGAQTGVKFPASFDLQAGTTYEIFIDFQANKSVFVHQAGASGKYMLRPVVHALDKLMTGSISGTLTDDTGKALGGVEVFAQTVAAGEPTIANTALTQADGTYSVGLLPIDRTYYVATQPVTVGATTKSYAAKASAGLTLTATAPVLSWSPVFSAVTSTGSVAGAVTRTSDPTADLTGTVVHARYPFDLGLGNATPLVVRTAVGSAAPVTYLVDSLPVSSLYTMVAELPATASTPALFSPATPATVTNGTVTTVPLVFP